jgi:fimbrial chaperone protein
VNIVKNVPRAPLALVVILSFALSMENAQAGQFTVTPVRIYMQPRDRAVAITVTNDGDTELVMQADLYDWSQKPDGSDDLKITEELFLSPPILKLAPKAKQVVRLARANPQPTKDQLTYRLIVREVPEAVPASKDDVQLQFALAFSLPIFVTPPGLKGQLGCAAERSSGDAIRVTCENTGSAYVYPHEFVLTDAAGETLATRDTGGYLLPGIKRSFEVKRPNAKIPGGNSKLTVTLDDGSKQTFGVALTE